MLLGRDRECAELERMLAQASRGRSAVLVLRGLPGIGKSVLLREAAARASGFVLLHARGVESEVELAFSGLGDLLRPVLDLLPEIPQPQAAVLASALAVGPPGRAASGKPPNTTVSALRSHWRLPSDRWRSF